MDLRGHGAAGGAREGQGGGCQAITVQLSSATGRWEEEDEGKEERG